MSADRWTRLRGILEEALDAPAGERAAVLERLCETSDERREVETLLASEDHSDPRLDPGAPRGVEELIDALEGAQLVGRHAGPYRLVELLATGGMGEVFKAVRDDGSFERTVAVKLIRRAVMSPHARRRFEAERRVLARLAHPNIAQLMDGGELSGRPFLVLEYVEGLPLRAHCAKHALDARARVGLVRTICEAVAHAHRNLVVHRDLKPSNVLVTPEGVPKLLDFGISKLLGPEVEDPALTVTRLLTPQYASPEQIRGEPVTTASDVYSLGVILHETLTGRPWGEHADGTKSTPQFTGVVEPPSRVAPGLDRELDAIVLEALAPEPARRYPSAESLGADLQRWLDGERVTAYAASRAYWARKWAWKHRVAIGIAGVVGLLVSTSAVVSGVMAARLAAERRETLAAKQDAEQVSRFLTQTLESAGARALGGDLTLGSILDDAARRLARDAGARPSVSAPLHLAIGRSLQSLGRNSDAEPHFRAAVADAEAAHGPDDPRTASARVELAGFLIVQGGFADAEEQVGRALASYRRGGGADGEGAITALYVRGKSQWVRRDNTAAEASFGEALESARRAGDEAWTARILGAMGDLELSKGRPEEAVAYRERALEIIARTRSEKSAAMAGALSELGEACLAAGKLERAEELLRRALAILRAVDGDRRAAASEPLRTLARVLEARGEVGAAEAIWTDGVAELERGLPNTRHDWVYLRENFAIFLMRQGRAAEARPHFELAAVTYLELLGPDHQRTRMARQAVEWADRAIIPEP